MCLRFCRPTGLLKGQEQRAALSQGLFLAALGQACLQKAPGLRAWQTALQEGCLWTALELTLQHTVLEKGRLETAPEEAHSQTASTWGLHLIAPDQGRWTPALAAGAVLCQIGSAALRARRLAVAQLAASVSLQIPHLVEVCLAAL